MTNPDDLGADPADAVNVDLPAPQEPATEAGAEPAPSARRRRPATEPKAPRPPGRAGRNLAAAVGVGLLLAALVVGSLFWRPEAFVAVVVLAVIVGVWEMRRALAAAHHLVPLLPLEVGGVSMVLAAYVSGAEGLVVAFGLTALGVLIWRVADGVTDAARDVGAAFLVALYPCLLGGFASLLVAAPDGPKRVFVFLVTTVFSDIGGYAVGVLAGRHPMAPSVSPKKSWEGFAGSVLACAGVGAASLHYVLGGAPWQGAVLGAALAVAATLGDLVESSIKRDIGIKDMGTLLPGHGGLMDRLDSLVVALPVGWLLLSWAVPLA